MSAGLLTLAFLISAPGDAAQRGLQKGDEFTFTGTIAEGIDRPGHRFRRNHELTVKVLVMDRQENWCDAAVLTRLHRVEDLVAGASGTITGNGPEKNSPPHIRLDLIRIHTDGTVHLLLPGGPPPLRLTAETTARAVQPIPLDTFSPFEFGVFPPRVPHGDAASEPWAVAAGAARPVEVWQAQKFDFCNAERCQLLVMNQQSEDWVKPVGGQTSWHRADAVWVSTRDGMARKVHRVIRHRDGLAKSPTAWVEVKYELQDQARLDGRTYDRARREVEMAYITLRDATTLLRDAARLGPKFFESRVGKLDVYLEQNLPGTPYREAIVAARRLLDAARRGEPAPTLPAAASELTTSVWPEVGQHAPTFQAGSLELREQPERPVVLVFFKPGGETTDLSVAIADALHKHYGSRLQVLALCVGDIKQASQARDRLKLTVPIHEGEAAAAAYGVDTVPRFAIIDAGGKVRWTFRGVGAETGYLVREQVDRLDRSDLPNDASVTTPTAGPTTPAQRPRR